MNSTEVANELTKQYAWNKFTFDTEMYTPNWRWRYLTSCVLVGGNNEADTLRCASFLFAKFPVPEILMEADWKDLADFIESFGLEYSGKKAEYIILIAREISRLGDVPNNREALETLPGVGRHVASVILATCFNQNEFAVDIHVRRIAKRLGIVHEKCSDRAIEKLIVEVVPAEQLGHFSRSFVDFGQTICGFAPKCGSCFFLESCKHGTSKSLGRMGQVITKVDGEYKVGTHTIRVNSGYARCDCTAGKYGKNCRHVKELTDS